MPRRNRRERPQPKPLSTGGRRWEERGRDGSVWLVQQVRGSDKAYVCPGCNQTIPDGTPHLVAWREDSIIGVEGRRHWHSPCWERSAHRR
jgi:hypothetical protein